MNKASLLLSCISLFMFVAVTNPSVAQNPAHVIVQTPLGQLQGIQDTTTGVSHFLGIRYGSAQRFEGPVAELAWDGIRPALAFGNHCPQSARYNLTEESLSEDCLYLNVTVPRDAPGRKALPVLIWIPGGGFVGGGSSLYQAERLANEGAMIVVTINYRVGLFGFMPHPAMDLTTNGTLGLEDQRLAMQWVKDNIAAFGGDPNNITLAGESAGSGSICMHLASPEHVQGLFQKAILISGACLQQLPTVDEALGDPLWQAVSQNPVNPAQQLQCPVPGDKGYSEMASLDCLKQASVADLLQAATFAAGNRLLSFTPVTGNGTVPRSFKEALESEQIMKVPMMMGGAKDELRLYVAYDVLGDNTNQTRYPVNLENLRQYYLPAFYGTDPNIHSKIIDRYFGADSGPKELNGATLGSMLSDYNPTVAINNCVSLETANALNNVKGMPAIYQFEFDDPNALVLGVGLARSKDPGFALGAVHSAILNYFFPNFSNTAAMDAAALPTASDALASQMIAYLSSFMHLGKPQVTHLPPWPPYDGSIQKPISNNVMRFTPGNLGTYAAYGASDPASREAHQCAFWKSLFPR